MRDSVTRNISRSCEPCDVPDYAITHRQGTRTLVPPYSTCFRVHRQHTRAQLTSFSAFFSSLAWSPAHQVLEADWTDLADGEVTDAAYNWALGAQRALWGILPAFLLGGALSYARLHWFRVIVTNRFK